MSALWARKEGIGDAVDYGAQDLVGNLSGGARPVARDPLRGSLEHHERHDARRMDRPRGGRAAADPDRRCRGNSRLSLRGHIHDPDMRESATCWLSMPRLVTWCTCWWSRTTR